MGAPTGLANPYPFYPFPAIPIPGQEDARPVPEFIGGVAEPKPIAEAPAIPQNPFMSSNPWNCGHDDSFMSDTYPLGLPGPLGDRAGVRSVFLGTSATNPLALSAILIFDRHGNLVAAPVKPLSETGQPYVQLTLVRATDLAILATLDHYAGAYLGPDGTLCVGVLGGIVALRDGAGAGP